MVVAGSCRCGESGGKGEMGPWISWERFAVRSSSLVEVGLVLWSVRWGTRWASEMGRKIPAPPLLLSFQVRRECICCDFKVERPFASKVRRYDLWICIALQLLECGSWQLTLLPCHGPLWIVPLLYCAEWFLLLLSWTTWIRWNRLKVESFRNLPLLNHIHDIGLKPCSCLHSWPPGFWIK